jgi:2-alkyl-3-oxoalkanoate reductase
MRLLVTGATGFLGRHLAIEAVRRGNDVVAIVRRDQESGCRGVETVVTDIRAIEAVELPRPISGVVHLATGNEGDEMADQAVAVDGTRAILRLARREGIPRFVHVSSMSVYGGGRGGSGHVPLEPYPARRGLYARCKVLADRTVEAFARDDGLGDMEIVIVRPGLVFGPGMKDVLAGTAVELPLGITVGLGRRNQGIPFLDISDFVNGLLAIFEQTPRPGSIRVFDILSGEPPPKHELLRAHDELTGRRHRQVWLPLAMVLAASKAIDRVRSTSLAYNLERMYRFEPRELPHRTFWYEIGRVPTGSVHRAVASALTAERHPACDGEDDALIRCVANDLLGVWNQKEAGDGERPCQLILIGAGRVVQEMHVPALRSLPEFEVRAVVDSNRQLAESAASSFPSASAYGSLEEVSDGLIDGATAVVATPGSTHAAIAAALLRNGCSILLEKPAALTHEGFEQLRDLESQLSPRVITVIHNYRLRPAALRLWRFLGHDVGALLRINTTFHAPRIELERARWMHDEKRTRSLVMETAIHFLDLACLLGGPITKIEHSSVVDRVDGRSTVSFTGFATMARCAELYFDLDLSGTAPRAQLQLHFERAVCQLDFYPDAFRVLPRKANPVDDLSYDVRRLGGAVMQRVRPRTNGVPKRVIPHHRIYLEHRRRLKKGGRSQFSIDGVSDTMRSLYLMTGAVYPDARPNTASS